MKNGETMLRVKRLLAMKAWADGWRERSQSSMAKYSCCAKVSISFISIKRIPIQPSASYLTDEIMAVLEEVAEHNCVCDDAVLVLHEDGGSQTDVSKHGLLQQRQHGPLVIVKRHVTVGPNGAKGVPEIDEGTVERVSSLRAGLTKPDFIRTVGDVEGAELGQQPSNNHCDGGREYEPGNATEGTLGDGSEGVGVLAGPGLPERLQGAHESSEEAEDGDSNTALGNDAENRHLP